MKFLNVGMIWQHNQLRGCRIPSWICCNLEGNDINLPNEECSEMDVNEGVIEEIHRRPCNELSLFDTPFPPTSLLRIPVLYPWILCFVRVRLFSNVVSLK